MGGDDSRDGGAAGFQLSVSIIVQGGAHHQPAGQRVSTLATGLRRLPSSTEIIVTGADSSQLVAAVQAATGKLIVIWDADSYDLTAEGLHALVHMLDVDGWELAALSWPDGGVPIAARIIGLAADPTGGIMTLRDDAAHDVFARVKGAEPLVDALLIARARGYRLRLIAPGPPAAGEHVGLVRRLRMTLYALRTHRKIFDLAEDADLLASRRNSKWRRQTLRLLIVFDIAALGWWLAWLLNISHASSAGLYGMLMLAQAINIFQVLGYWHAVWTLRDPSRRSGDIEGTVDVFITTFNEPIGVVEPTLAAAVAMRRLHRTFLLDDGERPEMGGLAARYGATWLTRADNRGHKAGNLNEALKSTSGDFFAVFDADHVPKPEFLERLLPWFRDRELAWVQAPQYYGNLDATYTAGGAMDQQAIFFGPVCEGMDGRDGVICCGTNFVMRRQALAQVGGFREDSVTEDAATGLELHSLGWRSRYVNEELAIGLAPEDLDAFMKQQRRWAQGNLELLFHNLGGLNRLRPSLRFLYAWAASNYLSGVSTLVYITLPCLFLFFRVQTVKTTTSDDFVAHFLPYIFLTIFIFVRSLDGRLRLRSIQVSFGLFPIHLLALGSVIFGNRIAFAVTPKVATGVSAYSLIAPQLVAIVLSAAAIVWAMHREVDASTVTNSCWALFNIAMLAGVVRAAAGHRATVPQQIPATEAA